MYDEFKDMKPFKLGGLIPHPKSDDERYEYACRLDRAFGITPKSREEFVAELRRHGF